MSKPFLRRSSRLALDLVKKGGMILLIKVDKLYYLITGLIYPAVLGAYIYEGSTKAIAVFGMGGFSALLSTVFTKGLIVLLLFFHYMGDFLYTLDENPKSYYSVPRFLSDIFIILSMFIAFRVAFNHSDVWIIALALSATKASSLVWEGFGGLKGIQSKNKSAIILDALFLVFYIIVTVTWAFHPAPTNMILIPVLFVDVLCFLFFECLHTKFKKSKLLMKIYASK